MEAFKGKFERTSAEKYEEMLKVIVVVSSSEKLTTFIGVRGELPPEEGGHSLHPRYKDI